MFQDFRRRLLLWQISDWKNLFGILFQGKIFVREAKFFKKSNRNSHQNWNQSFPHLITFSDNSQNFGSKQHTGHPYSQTWENGSKLQRLPWWPWVSFLHDAICLRQRKERIWMILGLPHHLDMKCQKSFITSPSCWKFAIRYFQKLENMSLLCKSKLWKVAWFPNNYLNVTCCFSDRNS